MIQVRRIHPLLLLQTVLLLLLFCMPEAALRGASAALHSCAGQIIPALFPFLLLCEWLTANPDLDRLGRPLAPIAQFACGQRSCGSTLLLGWLGGFAAGAQAIGGAYRRGQLTVLQAEALLPLCITVSPAFIFVTVGQLMLHSRRLGLALLGAIFGSNLLCGLLAGRWWLLKAAAPAAGGSPTPASHTSSSPGFSACAARAAQSMLTICALVVFFGAVNGILAQLPGLHRLYCLVCALLEVTNGCLQLSRLPAGRVFACCGALSWMGLSALAQVRALLPGELCLKPLLLARLLHLPCSLLLLHFLLRFLPAEAPAFSSLAPRVIPITHGQPDAAFVLFLLCCLALSQLERLPKAGSPKP